MNKSIRFDRAVICLIVAMLMIFHVFGTNPAHAESVTIASSVYIIDKSAGVISGVSAGTSVSGFKANLSNDSAAITVCDKDGNEYTGSSVATGMSVALSSGSVVQDRLTLAVAGDVNGDGMVSISDYTLVRLAILGLKGCDGAYAKAADANSDGKISISDYTLIRLHILGFRLLRPLAGALPLAGYVIGIDPGHQGDANYETEPVAPGSSDMKAKVSSGTQGRFTGVPEYIVNLQVGLKLQSKLEALGATVIMTRTTNNVNISNAERAVMMNEAGADCWVRIHANGNNNPAVYGMEMLVPATGTMNTADAGVAEKSAQLGQILLDSAAAMSGAKNLGLSVRSDQTGFCWSSVPVCNIEMGYMTNETEDNLLVSDAYQEKIAEGLAQGFIVYFGG